MERITDRDHISSSELIRRIKSNEPLPRKLPQPTSEEGISKRRFIRALLLGNLVLVVGLAGLVLVAANLVSQSSPNVKGLSQLGTSTRTTDNSLLVNLDEPNANFYLAAQEDNSIGLYEYQTGSISHGLVFSFNLINAGYPVASQIVNRGGGEFYYVDSQLGQDVINDYSLKGTRSILYRTAKKLKSIYPGGETVYALVRDTLATTEQYSVLEIDSLGSATSLTRFSSQENLYLKYAAGDLIYWGDLVGSNCTSFNLRTKMNDDLDCQKLQLLAELSKYKVVEQATSKFSPPAFGTGGDKPTYKVPFVAKVFDKGSTSQPIYTAPANQHVQVIAETSSATGVPLLTMLLESNDSNFRQLVNVDLSRLADLRASKLTELQAQKVDLPLATTADYLGNSVDNALLYFRFSDGNGGYNLYSYSSQSNQLKWLELMRCQPSSGVCDFAFLATLKQLI